MPVSDGTGVCAIKQGAPCVPVCFPHTWGNVSGSVFVGKMPVLREGSFIVCSLGGIITISSQNSSVSEAFLSKSVDVEDNSEISESSEKSAENSEVKPLDNEAKTEKANERVNDNSETKNEKVTVVSTEETKPATAESNRKNRWCSGRCPAEFKDNCEFCKASETCVTDPERVNNSEILKRNLKSVSSYERIVEKINGINIRLKDGYIVDWVIPQHHHLVSGNECLYRRKKEDNTMLFPLLVKLANLFKYNVNSLLNGIILPGYNSQKYINIMDGEKYQLAYDVMDKKIGSQESENGYIGSQIHFGPHTYENDLKKLKNKYKDKYPLLNNVGVYEKIVSSKLDAIYEKIYKMRYEKTCFMRDFEKEKDLFEKYINAIAEELRKNIKGFPRKNPKGFEIKKSAYVSLSAMAYDIGISVDELSSVLL